MKRNVRRWCCFSLLILLVACARPVFQGTDLTGANFGGDFQLTSHTGKPGKLSDFKGKAVALFFGYTHCPDVCPTTMSELKAAMQQLGDKAGQVQVLFVSVDPERDTQDVLSHYVPAFDGRFIGLTGTLPEVEKVAEQYKIVIQKQGSGANYTVDHSAGTYLLDKEGKLRVLVNYGAGPQALANDLSLLINE
ncbi:SCO1 protein [Andreprevotia sp. IGB-42]|uniref:SCO family protein n=1 Tax=Andreprevotia sp. IGB-42 TaxID=2497473 RepID=UPI00135B29D0|nr:SCO family protein [Andreprevotia sp. IGB-42]KAF0812850.1 SCO1 protein [Andreprevotia sp. IGB-42]